MIKNERQFRITRAQVQRLEESLEALLATVDSEVHPVRRELEVGALSGLIDELRASIDAYESLRDGTRVPRAITDVAAIPQALIEHRIAAGLNQRDLAERLGLKEQQVQRYESEDWSTANLNRLMAVADALGIAPAGQASPNVTLADLRKTVARAGVDPRFFEQRIAPASGGGLAKIIDLTSRLSRVYGWTADELLSGTVAEPQPPLDAASFKLPKRHKVARTSAYIVYSHYLALQAIAATPRLPVRTVPSDPAVMRGLMASAAGSTPFERALDVTWSLGVVVIPLADPGAFHAVLWRHQGRNVVVLKQQNRLASRWLFDLLHELRHAAESLDEPTFAVLDAEDGELDDREYEANEYAGAVLLDGRADEIAQEVGTASGGRVEALTKVVPRVAAANRVAVGDLANYIAYRLSVDSVNWWGAATNLQDRTENPWRLTATRFFQEIDLRRLNPIDRDLLVQAVREEE
jgi:transcriptional regulator with XRE-family HTH domain